MASLWRRAMVYLGLQDDDELAYDDYDYADSDEVEAVRRDPREGRELRDPRDIQSPRDPREPAEPGLTVRPIVRNDTAEAAPQRPSVIRTVPTTSARVHVLEPQGFNDAQEIGDRLKANQPVILNLRGATRELQRRLIDFSSGLAYAVGGHMQRVDEQVFLLTPTNVEVSQEEKERLQARGLYRV
jgi:cell division inhibitor SepF